MLSIKQKLIKKSAHKVRFISVNIYRKYNIPYNASDRFVRIHRAEAKGQISHSLCNRSGLLPVCSCRIFPHSILMFLG